MHLRFRDPRRSQSPPSHAPSLGPSGRVARAQVAPGLARSQCARFVALPVAIFFRVALVVLLLASGEPDLDLDLVLAPVELERDQRVALALDESDQPIDLAA